MSALHDIVEYRDNDCIFRYNKQTKILHVRGTPTSARNTILKLLREGWLNSNLRAVWFSGDPAATLLVGDALALFLTTKPTRRRSPRTFKEIVTKEA